MRAQIDTDVETFTISNLIAIHFLEGAARANLGMYKYQHKLLYILKGSGLVTVDNSVYDFSAGSFYTFRLANSVEIIASGVVEAFIVVFNITPFPYSKLVEDENRFIRRIQVIDKLFPDTLEIREHVMENVADRDSVVDLLNVARKEIRFPAAHSNEVIVNILLSIANVALRQQPREENRETYFRRSPMSVQMMRVAEDMLNENRKVTISEVARKLELSEYALNKIFIKHSGITFSNFLRNAKSRYVRF